MAIWPTTLPAPNFNGYTADPDAAFIRTDMESGAARERQRFTAAPHKVTVNWLFTAAQMAIFRTFYKTTVNMGSSWFTMSLDVGDGMVAYDCRFVAPYKPAPSPGMYWNVSATIEVRGA